MMLTQEEITQAASLLSSVHTKWVCKELQKIWNNHERQPFQCMCTKAERKDFIHRFSAWFSSILPEHYTQSNESV